MHSISISKDEDGNEWQGRWKDGATDEYEYRVATNGKFSEWQVPDKASVQMLRLMSMVGMLK